jgi:DNA-binding NarL/FixJ family response regulator
MKILLADPHPEVRSALQLIANRIAVVTEVRETGSLVKLLGMCAHDCPDLILFDLDFVRPTGANPQGLNDLVNVLRRLCPHSRVVAMSSRLEARQEALDAGAGGFISKTDAPDEVLAGIVKFLKNLS